MFIDAFISNHTIYLLQLISFYNNVPVLSPSVDGNFYDFTIFQVVEGEVLLLAMFAVSRICSKASEMFCNLVLRTNFT